MKLEDSLAAALTDRVPVVTPMGVTAENLADKYNITREESDGYAIQSQLRWKAGMSSFLFVTYNSSCCFLLNFIITYPGLDAGAFADEIVPITLPSRKKGAEPEIFSIDEHPRPQTTLASLGKLPTVFKKGGIVTAGTASGIADGAAANVVVSQKAVDEYGLKPLAKVLAYHVVAVEPSIMGIGPVEAIKGALGKAGLKIEDVDVSSRVRWENVHEIDTDAFHNLFSPLPHQLYLAIRRELSLPSDHLATSLFEIDKISF